MHYPTVTHVSQLQVLGRAVCLQVCLVQLARADTLLGSYRGIVLGKMSGRF